MFERRISPDDGPIEIDCEDCGTHHVVDPSAIARILRKRRIRCAACGRRWRREAIVAFAGNGTGRIEPICILCNRRFAP